MATTPEAANVGSGVGVADVGASDTFLLVGAYVGSGVACQLAMARGLGFELRALESERSTAGELLDEAQLKLGHRLLVEVEGVHGQRHGAELEARFGQRSRRHRALEPYCIALPAWTHCMQRAASARVATKQATGGAPRRNGCRDRWEL